MGAVEWEARLRPPMLFTYQQGWLGRIVRIREVEGAQRDACIEDLVATWPVMKMDVTKHVSDVAAPEVAVDHVQWRPYTASYMPKYSKALAEAGRGIRVSWSTHNLTNWVSPVARGDGNADPRPAAVQCFDCTYTTKAQECPDPTNFEVMRQCTDSPVGSSSTDHEMRCGRVAKSMAKDKVCLTAPDVCVYQNVVCMIPDRQGWRPSEGALSELRKKRLEVLHTRLQCTVDGRC